MTWNYRIVLLGGQLSLREVYYHADGQPYAMSAEPATFIAAEADEDALETITNSLANALKDACMNPILMPPLDWRTRTHE